MKILFVTYHCLIDRSSGAAVASLDLLSLLAKIGWDCRAFCGPVMDRPSSTAVATTEELRYVNVRDIAVTLVGGASETPPKRSDTDRFLSHLKRRLAVAGKPDLVIGYGGDDASQAAFQLSRGLGIPVLFALHNFSYTSADCFRACSGVLVPSKFCADYYRTNLGIESNRKMGCTQR